VERNHKVKKCKKQNAQNVKAKQEFHVFPISIIFLTSVNIAVLNGKKAEKLRDLNTFFGVTC